MNISTETYNTLIPKRIPIKHDTPNKRAIPLANLPNHPNAPNTPTNKPHNTSHGKPPQITAFQPQLLNLPLPPHKLIPKSFQKQFPLFFIGFGLKIVGFRLV